MNMPIVVLPFNQSVGFVLMALKEFLVLGHNPSYTELQMATGYSNPTVMRALRKLEDEQAIEIERPGPRKKNRYRILLEEV